jgi:adenylate cyclase
MSRVTAAVPLALALLALGGAAFFGWSTHGGGPRPRLEDFTFDLLNRLAPRPAAPLPVHVVDIDEASLMRLGQWPWPRTRLAELVERLREAGAAAIAFDIVFSEPDRTSPAEAARTWQVSTDLQERLASLPDHDRVLAASIAGGKVVTGFIATNFPGGTSRPAVKASAAFKGGGSGSRLPQFSDALTTLAPIEAAAAGNGAFNFVPSTDGIVRRVPLLLRIGDQTVPTIAAEALRVAAGAHNYLVDSDETGGISSVRIGRLAIPTDRSGAISVHFRDVPSGELLPAWRILAETPPPSIAGSIVFIGTSAPGLLDHTPTPLDAALPGVEVHAQLLETILGGSYLSRPGWTDGAELFLVAVTGLLMIVLVPATGARWTLLVLILTAGAVALGTGFLYVRSALMLDGSLSLVTAALLYTYLVYANYSREESQRRQIRSAFGQYLSPALVEQLATDPSRLKLGGELRNMTFLFCDIRSFTAISERYKDDPASLTRLINRYMTPMTNTILAHRGTIDKYIGDCIMAFWNAPLSDAEHARNACRGALSMMRELETLNAALTAEAEAGEAQQGAAPAGNGDTLAKRRVYTKSLAIGIGINTGDCIVGNMGSELRFDYSVLGDAVNLASRLESQSKNYGVAMVIGEDTERHVADFATIELDLIAVKGRAEAVHIFTVLGDGAHAATPGYQTLRQRHDTLIDAYRGRDWDGARRLLAECRALEPRLDALYQLYAARIAAYEKDPPPADWAGIYLAETK